MDCRALRYSRHAIERMFQREIPPNAVARIVAEGETIDQYPDDKPFPSALILGHFDNQPIHLVVARDPSMGMCHVITVYRPDPALWDEHFKTRRTP